jgi:hypothetical protein
VRFGHNNTFSLSLSNNPGRQIPNPRIQAVSPSGKAFRWATTRFISFAYESGVGKISALPSANTPSSPADIRLQRLTPTTKLNTRDLNLAKATTRAGRPISGCSSSPSSRIDAAHRASTILVTVGWLSPVCLTSPARVREPWFRKASITFPSFKRRSKVVSAWPEKFDVEEDFRDAAAIAYFLNFL